MSEEEYTLRNDEGDVQVVRVSDNESENLGAMSELLTQGYDFAEDSSDRELSVISVDENGQERVDRIPAGNVRQYQTEMQRLTGMRPLIITGDSQVSQYVQQTRENLARAERVRELSTSMSGVGLGLYSGAASLPIAAGRLTGIIDEGADVVLPGTDTPVSEISEARPGWQAIGNIATVLGTGGGRLIAGAGVRAAQLAGRAGAGRAGQVAAGLITEEVAFAGLSTAPLELMQQNPQLSAEALLSGAGIGAGLGYFLGPYRAAVRASRRAGTTQLFTGGSTAATPIARMMEDGRNPPIAPQPVNPNASRLSDMYNFPMRSDPSDPVGTPRYPRFRAAVVDRVQQATENRLFKNQFFHKMTPEQVRQYSDPEHVQDLTLTQSASRTAAGRNEMSLDQLNREVVDQVRTRVDMHDDVYRRLVEQDADESYRALIDTGRAVRILREPQGMFAASDSIARIVNEQLEALTLATKTTHTAQKKILEDVINGTRMSLKPLDDMMSYGQRRLQALPGTHINEITDAAAAETFHSSLRNAWRALGQTDNEIAIGLRKYLGEALSGRRSQKMLDDMSSPAAPAQLADSGGDLNGPIFGAAASERFGAVNQVFESRAQGGRYKIDQLLKDSTKGELTPGKFQSLMMQRRGATDNVTDFNQALDSIELDMERALGVLGDTYTGRLPGVAPEVVDGIRVTPTGDAAVSEARRIYSRKAAHEDLVSQTKQTGGMLASIALAQTVGGLIGTLFHPALGWIGGGAAAAASMMIRSMDRNPAQFLLQQGRARAQLIQYGERLAKGQKRVRKSLLSSIRLGSRLGKGSRLAGRALGFKILQSNVGRQQRVEEYNELRDRILDMAADPIGMSDQMTSSVAPIEGLNPQVAHDMRQTMFRAVGYLANHMTRPVTDPLMISNVAVPPSLAEVDSFTRRLWAIQDPLSILDDLADGMVTAEAAEAVGVVYPSIMSDIQAGIAEEIERLGDRAARIPYQARVNLSIMTNAATDTTLQPAFITAMNTRSAQTPQQASAQGLSRMQTRNINVASSFITKAQSLEEV